MTSAIIYTRVSSSQQEIDGTSLDTQLARCEAYCAENEYQIISRFSDTHTGAQYRERTGLSALRDHVRAGGVDVVVCFAIDRLSRNQAHLYILAEEFESKQCQLEFVTEDFEDSAVGRFIRSARAFAAEVEHEKIKERTTRGKLERIKTGKLLPTGRPLYGYQWRDDSRGQLDINPETVSIVARIFADYAAGTTIRQIAASLTAENIPPPVPTSNRWHFTTIRNILLNPSYKGEAYGWGFRRASPGGSQTFDPARGIAMPEGTIPAIIDPATWNHAQDRLALNKQRARRNAKHPESALLRGGFAKCGYCGWSMTARPRTNGKYEYVCGQSRLVGCDCPKPTISALKIDRTAWEQVRRFLLHPDVIESELEKMTTEDPTRDDRARVEKRLVDIERQRSNLTRGIAMIDDRDVASDLLIELQSLTHRKREMESELQALADRQRLWSATQVDLRSLRDWRLDASANLDDLTYEEKRLLFDLLGLQIEVWKANHTPRFLLHMNLSSSIVTSTSCRSDHNVTIAFSWSDTDLAKRGRK